MRNKNLIIRPGYTESAWLGPLQTYRPYPVIPPWLPFLSAKRVWEDMRTPVLMSGLIDAGQNTVADNFPIVTSGYNYCRSKGIVAFSEPLCKGSLCFDWEMYVSGQTFVIEEGLYPSVPGGSFSDTLILNGLIEFIEAPFDFSGSQYPGPSNRDWAQAALTVSSSGTLTHMQAACGTIIGSTLRYDIRRPIFGLVISGSTPNAFVREYNQGVDYDTCVLTAGMTLQIQNFMVLPAP